MQWIYLAQDGISWKAVVNTVMNSRFRKRRSILSPSEHLLVFQDLVIRNNTWLQSPGCSITFVFFILKQARETKMNSHYRSVANQNDTEEAEVRSDAADI